MAPPRTNNNPKNIARRILSNWTQGDLGTLQDWQDLKSGDPLRYEVLDARRVKEGYNLPGKNRYKQPVPYPLSALGRKRLRDVASTNKATPTNDPNPNSFTPDVGTTMTTTTASSPDTTAPPQNFQQKPDCSMEDANEVSLIQDQAMLARYTAFGQSGHEAQFSPKPLEESEAIIGVYIQDVGEKRIITAQLNFRGQLAVQCRDYTSTLKPLKPSKTNEEARPSNDLWITTWDELTQFVKLREDQSFKSYNDLLDYIFEEASENSHPYRNKEELNDPQIFKIGYLYDATDKQIDAKRANVLHVDSPQQDLIAVEHLMKLSIGFAERFSTLRRQIIHDLQYSQRANPYALRDTFKEMRFVHWFYATSVLHYITKLRNREMKSANKTLELPEGVLNKFGIQDDGSGSLSLAAPIETYQTHRARTAAEATMRANN